MLTVRSYSQLNFGIYACMYLIMIIMNKILFYPIDWEFKSQQMSRKGITILPKKKYIIQMLTLKKEASGNLL